MVDSAKLLAILLAFLKVSTTAPPMARQSEPLLERQWDFEKAPPSDVEMVGKLVSLLDAE